MIKTLSQHLSLSAFELEQLLSIPLVKFLELPAVKQLLADLDVSVLKQSLPQAKEILVQHLPPFYNWLKQELALDRVPDSPDHTTKWVVNFLNDREKLTNLVELHRSIPLPALELSIPRLVGVFDQIPEEKIRQEWQKAIAALCLVLVVAARYESTAKIGSMR
ncbi:MAG: hypothetical protein MUD14_13570 [Hydrococcus sp. Prado102]|jgi:hypothetical protein|nr:hypothetical protein [Hydrococcus sp. Prado102]